MRRDDLGYHAFCDHPVAARGEHGVQECALAGGDIASVRERPHKNSERGQRPAVIATRARSRFDRGLARFHSGIVGLVISAHKFCFHGTAPRAPVAVPVLSDGPRNCIANPDFTIFKDRGNCAAKAVSPRGSPVATLRRNGPLKGAADELPIKVINLLFPCVRFVNAGAFVQFEFRNGCREVEIVEGV